MAKFRNDVLEGWTKPASNTEEQKLENSNSHRGTAILKLEHSTINKLEGNYFTDRFTKGTLELDRKEVI